MSLFTPDIKGKVRKLTDPKLRKIRYEIRTLFYLFYQKKLLDLRDEYAFIKIKRERSRSLIWSEMEKIKLIYNRNPISCWFCGNRKDDLIQDPDSLFWFCVDHTMP